MSDQKPAALEDRHQEDGRLFSPSAGRNLAPIMSAFEAFELTTGQVIEFGAGTGEHAAHLVKAHAELSWLATERDPGSLESCQAWSDHFQLGDRMIVQALDLLTEFPEAKLPVADILYSSNVVHIAPIQVLENILAYSAHGLKSDGYLVFYGPFRRDGVHNSDGNENFDKSLKNRDPQWGVRDLEQDILPRAADASLELRHIRDMPANNYFVVFQKA
ncbi:MAG: hypothetical protein CMK09_14095 [Ponticaulis sp.]|nr:hypothetical protein [Ponticaulis sp.]